jgi:hypothetical protein
MAEGPTEKLTRLRQKEAELADLVDEIDAKQRDANTAVKAASDQLIQLERAALGGQKNQKALADAETVLLQAKTNQAAPWAERRQAAVQAVADARQTTATYVSSHLDQLLAVLAEEGTQAAEAIDRAAQDVLDRVAERARVEQSVFQLLALVGTPKPDDVQRTRSDELARQAEALILQGGERPPTATVRPGHEARYAQVGASA